MLDALNQQANRHSLSLLSIHSILLIVLLLFGSKKIPELARGLGKGIRYFKDVTSEVQDEIKDSIKDTDVDSDLKKGNNS